MALRASNYIYRNHHKKRSHMTTLLHPNFEGDMVFEQCAYSDDVEK